MTKQQFQTTLEVRFFRTACGNEPVRAWLKGLGQADRKAVGEEIKTVQIGWPLGMPLVRKMARDVWEIRITRPTRCMRILFTVAGDTMVLLHGFVKQSAATPRSDLDAATSRLKALRNGI
ncbi:type II toxin-antitoxin system RelE/ParE family toxin [Burkholderia sp. 4701]|nr:type II toxin-antitoxin system RelE/ParE family toxin [Burkholderia sp. 4701]MXN87115.1 type II toxin-antitoxin system RelE/ParE family toxin [Burkholderia sp. 4812]